MSSVRRSLLSLAAGASLLVGVLAIPAVASAGNVIFTCGAPGNQACTPSNGGTPSGPPSGAPVVTPGSGLGGTNLVAGLPLLSFSASCCPPAGANGSSQGFIRAVVGGGIFEAVVNSSNGSVVKIASGGDDIASMTITGVGAIFVRKGVGTAVAYTFVASDNGSAADTVKLSLANGQSISASCANCVEVVPSS